MDQGGSQTGVNPGQPGQTHRQLNAGEARCGGGRRNRATGHQFRCGLLRSDERSGARRTVAVAVPEVGGTVAGADRGGGGGWPVGPDLPQCVDFMPTTHVNSNYFAAFS